MAYKTAYEHKIRVDLYGFMNDQPYENYVYEACASSGLPGVTFAITYGVWDKSVSKSLTIEYISEECLPLDWQRFIDEIKRLFGQRCVLPTVARIVKDCTCDDEPTESVLTDEEPEPVPESWLIVGKNHCD